MVNYGDQLLFLIKMELRCTATACILSQREDDISGPIMDALQNTGRENVDLEGV